MFVRILDRERYWAFAKAYAVCYVTLVGLYMVIHAFSNIDEFADATDGFGDLLTHMGWYYLPRLSQFYDRLYGVITVMAAMFTITWMQKDNQLLAMMAAGVSAHRAVRPVLVSALAVSLLGVFNQERILPKYRFELEIQPDNRNLEEVTVFSRYDVNNISINGSRGLRARQSIKMNAIMPISLSGTLRNLMAEEAIHIPKNATGAPLRGGWLLRGAEITPPLGESDADKKLPIVKLEKADLKDYPPSMFGDERLGGDSEQIYFFRTNVTFDMMTRDRNWYMFASTRELMETLGDASNSPEHLTISLFVHARILRPLSTMILLLVSLPLVLGGYGQSTVINLGLALGMTTAYYASTFVIAYLGENQVLEPELAGWAPILIFGAIAAARWHKIRT